MSLIVRAELMYWYLFNEITDFTRILTTELLVPTAFDVGEELFFVGVPEWWVGL